MKRFVSWMIVASLLVMGMPVAAWCGEPPSTSLPQSKDEDVLTLNAVVLAATERHPLITAAVEERAGADGERLAAQGAFDRMLKGDFVDYATGGYSGTYFNMQAEQPLEMFGSKIVSGYRQGSGTFPIYDDYYDTNQNGEIRAGVEVPLLRDRDIDKRRAAIKKSTIQQDVASLSLESRKIDLGRTAGQAFWEWVAARRKRDVYQNLLKVAQERDSQLTERARMGDIAVFDQTDNRRQVLQRESQLLSAQRSLQKAEFELSFFYRGLEGQPLSVNSLHPPKVLPLIKPPALHDIDVKIDEAHAARPEVKRLKQVIEQQKVEIDLAENDLLPKVDAQSYLARDMGAGKQDRNETELKLGVKLEIPLQVRNQQGRIDQYSAKVRELTAQLNAVKDRIGVEVKDAINSIQITRDRVDVARQELTLAEELEQGERTKFVQGDSNLIFVNLREQTTADAAVREIDTVLEFQRAVINYHAALGQIEYVSR
jgi:cobalt-zinc-cadmium efflux system outer membrane protein